MARRKKILYLGNQLSKHGKNETGVEFLGRKLMSWGYAVKQVSSYKNSVLRLLHMLWSVLCFPRKHSVLLIDTYSTKNFWYAYLSAQLARIKGTPYICILHGGDLPTRLKKSPKMSHDLFNNALYNVAPSGYLIHQFLQQGYTNVRFIPNGFDVSEYSFKKRKEVAPRLLWVRSFAEIYHPLLAIQVLEQLLETYPDAQLSMVGPLDNDVFPRCKAYVEKHQLPVHFTGKLSKKEWISLSTNFDIFLNTTNFDNTPMSLMEAAALGLPIVSTRVGGIPYLLENQKHALLVKPRDVTEMLEAIKNVVENPIDAYQRTLYARQLVEGFDWRIIKEKWIQVLNS